MRSIVLSLVFLFVVSLGVQAQSANQKKEKVATSAVTTDKKEKCASEAKVYKKDCCADKKKCSSEKKSGAKSNCTDHVKEAPKTK